MRTTSVAGAKGHKSQAVPRPGTKLRAIYDLFYTSKGKVVAFNSSSHRHGGDYLRICQLRDMYGLDIRMIAPTKWCLVGEWFGKVYIDYTVED